MDNSLLRNLESYARDHHTDLLAEAKKARRIKQVLAALHLEKGLWNPG